VKLLLIVVLVVALASLLYLGLQAFLLDRARSPGPWRVRTITRDDGALVVMVVRGHESSRTVRELPADLDRSSWRASCASRATRPRCSQRSSTAATDGAGARSAEALRRYNARPVAG